MPTAYLKTQGVSPNDHPVKGELERVKQYMGKVKTETKKRKDRDSALQPAAFANFTSTPPRLARRVHTRMQRAV